MSATSIIIGILVLGICFGLMVWGQKYLGEEKGRNAGKSEDGEAIENPCRNCGGCEEKEDKS